MKTTFSMLLVGMAAAMVACGDSGSEDDGGISGEALACTIGDACFETEIPEGGDRAAGEKICTDGMGTASDNCSGTSLGCCTYANGIDQCWFGSVDAGATQQACENAGGTWD